MVSAGLGAEQLPLPRQGNCSKVIPAWDTLEWRTDRGWLYLSAKMENVQRGDKLTSKVPQILSFTTQRLWLGLISAPIP